MVESRSTGLVNRNFDRTIINLRSLSEALTFQVALEGNEPMRF
jgi:hypothetical protein